MIGVLAAITTVSFTGITNKAIIAGIKSELRSDATNLKLYITEYGSYPSALGPDNCPTLPNASNNHCIKAGSGNSISYTGSGQSFSLIITNMPTGISYKISESDNIMLIVPGFAYTWGGASVDVGYDTVQTSDGGHVVTGSTISFGAGDRDMFIAKYDVDGTLLWDKTWGGTGIDYGSSIVQTSDGGYIVAGYTVSFGVGSSDAFIAKYTSDGTLSWDKTWGGGNYDYVQDIIQSSDGGYVITGYTESFGTGNDMFIVKYTSDGTFSWDKCWGGNNVDQGYSVAQIADGGLIVTGYTTSYGTNGDALLVKYDTNGNLLWDKTWSKNNADYGQSIYPTSDGGFVLTGYAYGIGAGVNDMLIAKYDSSGTLTWDKLWGGTGNDYGRSVYQTSDGGYVVVGDTISFGAANKNIFIAKYASDGALSWDRTWDGGGADVGYSVFQLSDGGYIVTGDYSGTDVAILKYTSSSDIPGCSAPTCQDPVASDNDPVPLAEPNPTPTNVASPAATDSSSVSATEKDDFTATYNKLY